MTITATRSRAGRNDGALTRAVLVDDHQLLTQTLALALGLEGIECTIAALDDREALIHEVVVGPPALILLDLDLGAIIGDGADLVASFASAGCRVLVVSGSRDVEHVCRAIDAGAVGAVGKEVPFERLLETALAASRGEQVMADCERQAIHDEARRLRTRREHGLAPFERLSPRESEVLRALAAGVAVACIAESAFVSEATVRSQVRAILTKLGVGSQLEAVAAAHRSGWLQR